MTNSKITLVSALCAMIFAQPAFAMNWAIYAPDEGGWRYWIDRDSINTQGRFIYFTIAMSDDNSAAPTSPDGSRLALDCNTGDSLREDDGNYVAGPNYGKTAHLRKFLCRPQN